MFSFSQTSSNQPTATVPLNTQKRIPLYNPKVIRKKSRKMTVWLWQYHPSSASECQTDTELVHAVDRNIQKDESSLYSITNKLFPMPPCEFICF